MKIQQPSEENLKEHDEAHEEIWACQWEKDEVGGGVELPGEVRAKLVIICSVIIIFVIPALLF